MDSTGFVCMMISLFSSCLVLYTSFVQQVPQADQLLEISSGITCRRRIDLFSYDSQVFEMTLSVASP